MRRRLFLVSLVCLLLLIFLVQATVVHNQPKLQANLMSQDPDPVQPGQMVKVKFKVENEGSQTSQEVIAKIQPKFPFSSYDGFTEKNLGKLRAGSTGADATVVEFKLRVADNAVEGDAEIELLVLIGNEGGVSYTNDEFTLNVKTQDPILDITAISAEPPQIAPGETGTVTVMVKNSADSLLKDIKFSLNFAGLSLAPYHSSSERRLGKLESGYQNSVAFQIIADPEATPGLYKIPLNITYYDEEGDLYRVEDYLAVTVGEVPKVRAYLKKSTVLKANSPGKLTLEVANAGSSEIKFLELILLPSEDYTLVSTSRYFYLGNVDSDDTESEEVDLFIIRGAKILHFPVQLKYYDANNKPFQQQFDLELFLYSSSQLKKFGVLPTSKVGIYLFLVMAVIGGILFYRRCRKNPEGWRGVLKGLRKRVHFKFKKKT